MLSFPIYALCIAALFPYLYIVHSSSYLCAVHSGSWQVQWGCTWYTAEVAQQLIKTFTALVEDPAQAHQRAYNHL